MTVMEFLARLAATPRDWRLIVDVDGRRIRSATLYCPVAAAGSSPLTGPGAVPFETVMRAADDLVGHDPTIRAALLAACGLTDA